MVHSANILAKIRTECKRIFPELKYRDESEIVLKRYLPSNDWSTIHSSELVIDGMHILVCELDNDEGCGGDNRNRNSNVVCAGGGGRGHVGGGGSSSKQTKLQFTSKDSKEVEIFDDAEESQSRSMPNKSICGGGGGGGGDVVINLIDGDTDDDKESSSSSSSSSSSEKISATIFDDKNPEQTATIKFDKYSTSKMEVQNLCLEALPHLFLVTELRIDVLSGQQEQEYWTELVVPSYLKDGCTLKIIVLKEVRSIATSPFLLFFFHVIFIVFLFSAAAVLLPRPLVGQARGCGGAKYWLEATDPAAGGGLRPSNGNIFLAPFVYSFSNPLF